MTHSAKSKKSASEYSSVKDDSEEEEVKSPVRVRVNRLTSVAEEEEDDH